MPRKVSIKTLLRTNDAFLSTSDRVYNYFLAHSKRIWMIVAAVVAVVLIALLVRHFHDARLAKATEAFHQASAQADPAIAAADLAKVAQDFSGTPGARQASFALVSNHLAANKPAEALPILEELSRTLAPGEESLRPLVQSTLAALYEEGGQTDQALATYRTALDLVRLSPLTPASQNFQAELLASIGRVSLALGRTSEAVGAYEELLGLAPDGYRSYVAQLKLAELTSVSPADTAEPQASGAAEPESAPVASEGADTAASPEAGAEAAPAAGDAPETEAEATPAADTAAPETEAEATPAGDPAPKADADAEAAPAGEAAPETDAEPTSPAGENPPDSAAPPADDADGTPSENGPPAASDAPSQDAAGTAGD